MGRKVLRKKMKKVLSKIWEWLTFLFAGIVLGIILFWEVVKNNINNQNFTIKKIKTKGDDNNMDLDLKVNQKQDNKREKKKRRKHEKFIQRNNKHKE